jgi:dephospho-CoA kinase
MKIIGLTGSIGMGKSTAAAMLKDMGVPVHEADAAVHKLMQAGGAAVAAVRDLYPAAYAVNAKGEGFIDRAVLGRAAFDDDALMKKLEAILHPLVRQEEKRFLDEARAKGAALAVLDIPLLFETGGEARVDAVWVVSAPSFVQRLRVMRRPGMTKEKFASILTKQMPDEEKRRRAQAVVPTGFGRWVTRVWLGCLVKTVTKRIS